MASVASQLIEEVTAHAQSDSLEDAREICADGTYFPNNLRIKIPLKLYLRDEIPLDHIHRGRCLYTHTRQNIRGCELVLQEAHYQTALKSQNCNYMLVSFTYSRILIF